MPVKYLKKINIQVTEYKEQFNHWEIVGARYQLNLQYKSAVYLPKVKQDGSLSFYFFPLPIRLQRLTHTHTHTP